ncbi:MAG: efflux RND transporter permease subunit [Bacteroides sp.]|nr:efflux RND transporter permease subunit [Roseburia sp.]MCM1347099.1 efflux RND transporter permease subunit [Bacteroides sp.]MCM1420720.1 efflux RND transporter permease subunit [Bacteroides sp.]
MTDYSKWALDNRKLINFFIICLVIGGILSYNSMSKLEDPAIKVKQAMVVTTYPGASAHQVELEVTDMLEKSIREMSGVNNVQSQSYPDLSIITVELETTIPNEQVEQQWDMLRRKVSNTQTKLPSGASTPAVKDDFGDVYGMFYAMTGDGLKDRELSDYAEMVKREVCNIDGVTRVDIYGKRSDCINIELKEDKMANLGVMPTEVIQTLSNQNKTAYSGYYNNGSNRIRVTVNDKFRTVDDIADMLIQGHDEDQLRIRDIANVYESYETPTRNELKRDGERALGLSIACSADYDIIKVGKIVEDKISELTETMPAGIEFHKVFFQPERVSDALNTFLINLLESVIIVVVVLIFAMGFKSGVIIGVSLVVIVFGSFLILQGFDGTLQRVSLASFILAMGMLVDNAIVIVDGILVDLKQGKPRMEALTSIGRKTAMPLLGATLIAILAFLPIFLSPDTAGVYVRDLFIVMAVSLLLSWLLALLHVPIMADKMLKADKVDNNQAAYSGKAYGILSKILNFGLNHRLLIVITAVVLLAGSAVCYKFLNQAFFPDMEYDQLYMEYKLPEGTNSTQVEKDLTEIEKYLGSRKEVKHVTASVGGTPSRYNLVRSIATPSLSYGELIIDFESPKALVNNITEIQDELSKRYPDAYIKLKRYNLMFKKYPIEACFHGPDPAVLHALCDSALHIVRQSDVVYLPTTDWEPQVPVLTIDYDQPSARISGLSRSDVSMSILAYTGGIPVGTFYDGIHPENIYIKCTDDNGNEIERLDNVAVFGILPNINKVMNRSTVQKLMAGTMDKEEVIESLIQTTPMRQVAKGIDIKWEEPVVMRYNGQRTQRVQCSPRPGTGTEAARKAIAKKIEAIELPAGYSLSWEGEKKASDQSLRYLFNNFPMSIVIMIMILIMLFKDYKKPAIIFCCIPLILIGVIPTVLLSGKDFGFVAIVGVLGLIGMMIKNGIVLMDEINLEISSGMAPREALINSSKSRLRPVMMASLTTILGMIPLVTDSMFGSLAVTIMGGLFVGTLITLIFIPVLYSLFFKIK